MATLTNLRFVPTKKGLLSLGRHMGLDIPRNEKLLRTRTRTGCRGDKELNWYGSDHNIRFLYCFRDFRGCMMVTGRRTVDGFEYDIQQRTVEDVFFLRCGILREVA